MPKRFDATLKHLPEDYPQDWARHVGVPKSAPVTVASQLLKGVRSMKESVTYQAILEEGRSDEARRILLVQGTKRFGKPSAKHRKTVAAISEPAVFEGLATRLLEVESWSELLAGL